MVWQPTMRIWAGDQIKVDEKELESDAMEGVESTGAPVAGNGAAAEAGPSAGPSESSSSSAKKDEKAAQNGEKDK